MKAANTDLISFTLKQFDLEGLSVTNYLHL
jgi:hypothetical protein